jgi:hypothetical protein
LDSERYREIWKRKPVSGKVRGIGGRWYAQPHLKNIKSSFILKKGSNEIVPR